MELLENVILDDVLRYIKDKNKHGVSSISMIELSGYVYVSIETVRKSLSIAKSNEFIVMKRFNNTKHITEKGKEYLKLLES